MNVKVICPITEEHTNVMAVVGFIAWITAKSLKFERSILSAVLLTTMFMNAGNYGLPLALFAFGEAALSYASIYFITIHWDRLVITMVSGYFHCCVNIRIAVSMNRENLRDIIDPSAAGEH